MGSVMFACLVLLTVLALPVYSQDCTAGKLGPLVDEEVNEGCSGNFNNGSVQIAGGLACYNGLAPGSLAEYTCNCPQYELEGSRTRICQADGTWNGSVPECLPQCQSIPRPQKHFSQFVGPVNCSANSPNVTATYSCGFRDNMMIQFNISADGDCQWPDPPCSVWFLSLATTGAGFYGSVMFNIFFLVIGLLVCYKLPNKGFIPFILVVSLILPPVGLFWAWWLVREQAPASLPAERHKSFARRWWRAILVIVGSILWLICFVFWIAVAAIFAPPNAFPSRGDYNLLIAAFAFVTITMTYWIVGLQLLCQLYGRRRACCTCCPGAVTADQADCRSFGINKSGVEEPDDIPFGRATLNEYGKETL